MKEVNEYSEEDSISKENRIRRVADFESIDIGNEGNKSTYLRPSKNRSTADINKSLILKSHREASISMNR